MPRTSWDLVSQYKAFVPSIEEQLRIADYLDAQCARLDKTILEALHLVRLLDEHEFGAISAALGCRTDGARADRDWPWMGALQPTWRLVALKRIATIQSGLTLGKSYDEPVDARPYLRVANVKNGEIDTANVAEVEVPQEVVVRHTLMAGDVLMTEGGDNDKLGRGAIWDGRIEGCLHQNHIFAVRTDPSALRPEYLAALLSCAHGRAYFTSTAVQATNLASTSRAKVGAFPVPLPPLEEQNSVLCRINEVRQVASAARSTIDREIMLLRERRQALITAAVTGQFDVSSAA